MAGGEEFFAGFVERLGVYGEDDAAVGFADEIKAAISLNETKFFGHGRSGSIHRIGCGIKIELKANGGNSDLYQIGTEADERELNPSLLEIDADDLARKAKGGDGGGAGAEERVEDEVTFVGGGEEDAFEESDGFLRGVFTKNLLFFRGRIDFPDGFHLAIAVVLLHERVVEGVAALGVFGGPDDGFGGVSEVAAGKVGGRIGFDPGDVVEELEAELLHGEADGMDDVAGAADPNGAVGFQDALAGGKPGAIKLMVRIGSAGAVPIAFVDADHAAGVAGDAVVGEEVRRVGEDEVDTGFRDGGEDFDAVALEDFDVVGGIVKDGLGKLRRRRGVKGSVFCGLGGFAQWDAIGSLIE